MKKQKMEEKKNYSVKIISDTPLATEQLYQIAQILSKILPKETIIPFDMLDEDNVLKYEFIKEQAEDFKNELEKVDIKCSIVEPTNDVKIIPDKPLTIEQLVEDLENELGEGSTKYSIVEPTISENKEVEEEKEYQVEIVFINFLTQISRSRLTDAQREKIAEIIRKVIPHENVDSFKMWDAMGRDLLEEIFNPFRMPGFHRIKYLLTKQQAETLKKELESLDIISGVSIVMLKEELVEEERRKSEQEKQEKQKQLKEKEIRLKREQENLALKKFKTGMKVFGLVALCICFPPAFIYLIFIVCFEKINKKYFLRASLRVKEFLKLARTAIIIVSVIFGIVLVIVLLSILNCTYHYTY